MSYNAMLSDKEEQCLLTQPAAVDLMVDSDSRKHKGTTQVDSTSKKKQLPELLLTQPSPVDLMVDLDSRKHKGTTQVDKTSKKKQLPEISDASLAVHLKQVSIVNTHNSLLQGCYQRQKGGHQRDAQESNQVIHHTRSWQEVILVGGGI